MSLRRRSPAKEHRLGPQNRTGQLGWALFQTCTDGAIQLHEDHLELAVAIAIAGSAEWTVKNLFSERTDIALQVE